VVSEVDLLDRYPRTTRDIAARAAAVPAQRQVAMRFAREYFDGDRGQGYGGYRYDGRWVPVAERIRDFYGLRAGDRVLDIGCAKGFLLHDLRRVVPGLRVSGLDISDYALIHAMEDVRPGLVRGSADRLPFRSGAFDLVVSINTIHNLERADCIRALREMERVGRRHRYVQVDSWLTELQREKFERWQLTARTYSDPDGWRRLFAEAGYTGDYYWTVTD
jgi:SAM-dependent methyltransferase